MTENENGEVSCNICNKVIKRGSNLRSNNTTNIHRHLAKGHPEEFSRELDKYNQEITEKEAKVRKVDTFFSQHSSKASVTSAQSSSNVPSTSLSLTSTDSLSLACADTVILKQPTLIENLEARKIWDINDSKSMEMHFMVGEMIALDCHTISIVDEQGFRNLIHHAKPNYPIPSRHFLTEKIIPCMYETARNLICDALLKTSFLSFTTDIWSSGEKMFISCTAHCIFENFDQQVLLLHVSPFSNSHTGEQIEKILKDMIHDFDIPDKKVHQICHDNASNMVLGVQNTGYASLSCFIHTTQLAIKGSIFNQASVRNVIAKCRNICSHFHRSPKSCQTLHQLQKTLQKKILSVVQDVVTRWNSTYMMLKRMLELKEEMVLYLMDKKNSIEYSLSSDDWELIEKIVELLEPFYDATNRWVQQI